MKMSETPQERFEKMLELARKSPVGDPNLLKARVKQATFILREHRDYVFILPIQIFLGFYRELLEIVLILNLVKSWRNEEHELQSSSRTSEKG